MKNPEEDKPTALETFFQRATFESFLLTVLSRATCGGVDGVVLTCDCHRYFPTIYVGMLYCGEKTLILLPSEKKSRFQAVHNLVGRIKLLLFLSLYL